MRWTHNQIEFLRDNYGHVNPQILIKNTGHSYGGVHWKARDLGLKSPRRLPEAKIPEKATPDVAYILGVLCGDGHLSTRLTLADCNLDFVKAFQKAIKNCTGLDYRIRIYIHRINWVGKKSWEGIRYEVSVRQQRILDYFASLGTFGTRTWKVPNCVLNGTKEMKSAFLRGLYDSEGSVHTSLKNNIRFASIELGVVNPEVKNIIPLLKEFNIVAHFTNAKTMDVYKVVISDLLSLIFYSVFVGFSIPCKTEKLTPYLRFPTRTSRRFRELRTIGLKHNFHPDIFKKLGTKGLAKFFPEQELLHWYPKIEERRQNNETS